MLKLDKRTLNLPHGCAVQSKLRRPRAALQLQLALLQAPALLSAAGLVGTSDAIRRRETAADTACRCW